jgi:hypothetical protein
VQLAALKPPVPLEPKLTVPLGADFVPESVSVTVAVQLVLWLKATEAGVQLTLVCVERLVTTRLKKPELVSWVVEPW